jgi:hypothetical protein
MGWRFRKSVKILPGFRLNFGKRGITSATFGGKWFKTNVSGKGVRNTASLPGTGISHTSYTPHNSSRSQGGSVQRIPSPPIWFCPNCGFENVHGRQTCSYCQYFNAPYQPHRFQYGSAPSSNTTAWVTAMGGGVALAIVLGFCGICGLMSIVTPDRSAPGSVQSTKPVAVVTTPSPTPTVSPTPTRKGKKGKAANKVEQDPLYAVPPAVPSYDRQQQTYSRQPRSNGFIRGPRGGCYYINSRGNKTYVDRSLCG